MTFIDNMSITLKFIQFSGYFALFKHKSVKKKLSLRYDKLITRSVIDKMNTFYLEHIAILNDRFLFVALVTIFPNSLRFLKY